MKSPYIIATALSFILLTACIRIDITQTINKTGEAQVEMTYDLSKLAAMAESMTDEREGGELSIGVYGPTSSSSSSSSSDNFDCTQFSKNQGKKPIPGMKSVHCQDKAKNVIVITGTQKLSRSEFVRRRSGKKTVYLYKVQSANKLMASQEDGVQQESPSDPSMDKLGQDFAESILEGTFTVIMPGRITKSPAGTISGNRVTFKTSDFPLKNGGFIQSEE